MIQNLRILFFIVIPAFGAVGQDTILPPPEIMPDFGLSSTYKDYSPIATFLFRRTTNTYSRILVTDEDSFTLIYP